MLDRRFTPLVLVLVLSLLPIELVGVRWLQVLIRGGTLAAAAMAVGRTRKARVGILGLLAPILLIQVLELFFPSPLYLGFSVSLAAAFLTFVLWVVTKEVIVSQRVNPDVLMGGIAIYLLVGHLFGMFFVLLETLQPGSFSNLPPDGPPVEPLQYFSFVTLTTLGYGDIGPLTMLARRAVVLEAVIGQIYLTVFVGRLVGYSFPEPETDLEEDA